MNLFESNSTNQIQNTLNPIDPELINLKLWTASAIDIIKKFEGKDFANITGNFDGTGLTCGALGWTIKWNNQQPLVKKFVSTFGINELLRKMPKTGSQYWDIIQISDYNLAIEKANEWSNSSSIVIEPYRSELNALWSDTRMINIQYDFAEITIGQWAKKQAIDFSISLKVHLNFKYFVYFFDQAVLNGKNGVPKIEEAQKITNEEIFSWMESYNEGYTQTEFKKNRALWAKIIKNQTLDFQLLFKMAYLRALMSKPFFKPVTMNRRGALALGSGYVNGVLYQ